MYPNNLLLQNLCDDVTEGVLYKICSAFGKISGLQVAREPITDTHLHCAFVTYTCIEDVIKAKHALKNFPLNGKPMKVSQVFLPINSRNLEEYVVVNNFDKNITKIHLLNKYSKYGKITFCIIAIDVDGNSRGYALLGFENVNAAKAMLDNANGTDLYGSTVTVEKYDFKNYCFKNLSIAKLPKRPTFTIFVRRLRDVTEIKLYTLFCQFGPIAKINVFRNLAGSSWKFGTVTFYNKTCAFEAQTSFLGKLVEGNRLIVTLNDPDFNEPEDDTNFNPKKHSPENLLVNGNARYTLLVKFLTNMTEEKLFNLFSDYGTIVMVNSLEINARGVTYDFGVVAFLSKDNADDALEFLHARPIEGRRLFVSKLYDDPEKALEQELKEQEEEDSDDSTDTWETSESSENSESIGSSDTESISSLEDTKDANLEIKDTEDCSSCSSDETIKWENQEEEDSKDSSSKAEKEKYEKIQELEMIDYVIEDDSCGYNKYMEEAEVMDDLDIEIDELQAEIEALSFKQQKGVDLIPQSFDPARHTIQNYNKRRDGKLVYTIFVKNLFEVSEIKLYNIFCHFGRIIKVEVVTNPFPGFDMGLVTYFEETHAEIAIECLNGICLEGSPLILIRMYTNNLLLPADEEEEQEESNVINNNETQVTTKETLEEETKSETTKVDTNSKAPKVIEQNEVPVDYLEFVEDMYAQELEEEDSGDGLPGQEKD